MHLTGCGGNAAAFLHLFKSFLYKCTLREYDEYRSRMKRGGVGMIVIRRITAVMICAVLLLSGTVSANAVMALPLEVGDVDRDRDITSVDATLIQRFLGKLREPEELEIALSDADGDGEMTVLDATAIQRSLANLPGGMKNAEINDWFIGDTSFHTSTEIANVDSVSSTEIGYVGVPVLFSAKVYWGAQPRLFTLSVDGETVQTVEANSFDKVVMTHTFQKEGEYVLSCDAECRYGLHTSFSRRIRVRSLPEDGSPVVTGAAFYDASHTSSGNSVLTVTAAGGTAPYEYCYTLYYDGLSPLCAPPEEESEDQTILMPSEYCTGYIKENEINLNRMFSRYVPKPTDGSRTDIMRVRVTVRDAAGKESQPVTAGYFGYQICY